MNDLMPRFERESGQVILESLLPAGAAGEACLIPAPGLELAFDRVDGRLCRAVVDTAGTDGSIAVGEQAAAVLIRLFGAEAPNIASGIATWPGRARVLSPEPGLAGSLSSLARIDAARATSPVPPGSPWWAAEAAELAKYAGLRLRARAEARRAMARLLGQLDGSALPERAVRAALEVADINAADEPEAADRLRAVIARQSGPYRTALAQVPALDAAAEVRGLENDRVGLVGLQWTLDPGLMSAGLFRSGLSPRSDLFVRHEGAKGCIVVEALLASGADSDAISRCRARLVDPAARRTLAQASFTRARSRVRAELRLLSPLAEPAEVWIEVVQNTGCPVRSAQGHRIRHALRWADAALRAERAPAGLAPESAREDWAALAAAAWEQSRRSWEAAGDADRAYMAARRQALFDPKTCVPQAPSDPAAEIARQVPIDGPAYLAEALGR
jgi:hypothetical protein